MTKPRMTNEIPMTKDEIRNKCVGQGRQHHYMTLGLPCSSFRHSNFVIRHSFDGFEVSSFEFGPSSIQISIDTCRTSVVFLAASASSLARPATTVLASPKSIRQLSSV